MVKRILWSHLFYRIPGMFLILMNMNTSRVILDQNRAHWYNQFHSVSSTILTITLHIVLGTRCPNWKLNYPRIWWRLHKWLPFEWLAALKRKTEEKILWHIIPFTIDTALHTYTFKVKEKGIKGLMYSHRQKAYNFSCYYLLKFENERKCIITSPLS